MSTHNKNTIKIKGQLIDLNHKLVMGILNLTPDSFFDGGRLTSMKNILQKAENMLTEGASILDIGGYSSRPGAAEISDETELSRIIEPILQIKKRFPKSIISVDTYRANVAHIAIESGVDIVNDISAGTFDPKMPELIAKNNFPYIIMHMQGKPTNMQNNPSYDNVVKDIMSWFSDRISYFHSLGITDLIIDPGFGFGKTIPHNYELLAGLDLFKQFNLPILVGLSRKSMIYKAIDTEPEYALNGTSVLQTIALMKGADILRVHDVKEAVEAIKLVDLYNNPKRNR
ncbi:dihydropteroate synthase [Bacteroidota bacterium]